MNELGYIFSRNSFGNFFFSFLQMKNLKQNVVFFFSFLQMKNLKQNIVFFFFSFLFFPPPQNPVLPFEPIRAPQQKSLSKPLAGCSSHKTYHVAANDTIIILSPSLLSQTKLSINKLKCEDFSAFLSNLPQKNLS